MKIFFKKTRGGWRISGVDMPIPPRIGEAVWIPNDPNIWRVVDVSWDVGGGDATVTVELATQANSPSAEKK